MDFWRGSGAVDATRIMVAHERFRYAVLVVENNGTQESFRDLIHQATNGQLPTAGFTTGSNKAHIELGIPALEVQVRNGMWALCMDDPYDTGTPLSSHDPGCDCAFHTFISDLNNYPSPGRSYDLMMAWWFTESVFRGISLGRAGDDGGRPDDEGSIPEDELSGLIF